MYGARALGEIMEEGHGGKTPDGSTDQTHKGRGTRARGKRTGQWHTARTWEKGRGQVQGARARFKDRSSYVPGADGIYSVYSPNNIQFKVPERVVVSALFEVLFLEILALPPFGTSAPAPLGSGALQPSKCNHFSL